MENKWWNYPGENGFCGSFCKILSCKCRESSEAFFFRFHPDRNWTKKAQLYPTRTLQSHQIFLQSTCEPERTVSPPRSKFDRLSGKQQNLAAGTFEFSRSHPSGISSDAYINGRKFHSLSTCRNLHCSICITANSLPIPNCHVWVDRLLPFYHSG